MTPEQAAAVEFIKNCKHTYPEIDLMDEDTRYMYDKCWQIVHSIPKKQEIDPYDYEEKEIRRQKPKKPKKIGKLKQFENDVAECIRQGFGEEKQLLEEAYNRKNPFARANYIKAYWRGVVKARES